MIIEIEENWRAAKMKWQNYILITDLEYASMPPVFHLDDFDRCMVLGEKAYYCTVTAQVAPLDPKNPSEVWKTIQVRKSKNKSTRGK